MKCFIIKNSTEQQLINHNWFK